MLLERPTNLIPTTFRYQAARCRNGPTAGE
jgi:hypothetical protein